MDINNYIVDFERIKYLSDNGIITINNKNTFNSLGEKGFSNVNSFVLYKMLNQFISFAINSGMRPPDNYEFVIKTLVYNKILIKERCVKINKILNNEN